MTEIRIETPEEFVQRKSKMISSALSKNLEVRETFSVQILSALLSSSNNRGVLPNAEMMAKEAIKYTDALILELSK